MLRNYLKIALRNIRRNKIYSFINIAGLTVGVTCFLILLLFIRNELSYDSFNKDAANTYRVFIQANINGHNASNAKTPGPLGPILKQTYPNVLNYTRIGYFGMYTFRFQNKVFNEWSVYAADSTFFKFFPLKFLAGNPATALNRPNTMVITESAAKKYFGDVNPVGKMLKVEKGHTRKTTDDGNNKQASDREFLITGLVKDFPQNSHFRCRFLTSMSTYKVNPNWLGSGSSDFTTYITLKKGTDPITFEQKLKQIKKTYVAPAASKLGISMNQFKSNGNIYRFELEPMNAIYLQSQRTYGIDPNTEWPATSTGDILYVYIFSSVALFILLIAIINFMNLETAKSEKRGKEVGIRKTLGSNRTRLMGQFMSEAILMSSISVILSVVLLKFLLPFFNDLTGKSLEIGLFNNFYTIPLLIGFVIVLGIFSGSYPALYLSSFRPAQVLKSGKGIDNRKSILRSILVIVQFAISITLLIGTIVIWRQLNYVQNKNLGFNKQYLITISNPEFLGNKIDAFKNELLQNPKIVDLTNSSRMFTTGIPGEAYFGKKKSREDLVTTRDLNVDYHFLQTYGIRLLQGRFFSKKYGTDSTAVVINEAAAKSFGMKDPVGKEVTAFDHQNMPLRIIGVIQNFNYESLHHEIRPLVLHLARANTPAGLITIRVEPGNAASVIRLIKNDWHKYAGRTNINYNFVDQKLANLYKSVVQTGTLVTIFSLIAIFIACLGLFGIAAFVTEQRTKEIGIRKILGASLIELIVLLSKEFLKWVVIANIIAWPVAWFVMNDWLQNFAYRTGLSWWIFVLSGVMALLIALVTVSWQSVKTALVNPVKSLRSE